jgi:hypothetical protein
MNQGMILFYFGLPSDEPWLIGSAVAAGFFIIALLPVAFETAVEITYPVNEATSAGLAKENQTKKKSNRFFSLKDCW